MKKTRKTKGFVYDPIRDKQIIDFLNTQPNISAYILNLIKQDMQPTQSTNPTNLTNIEQIVKKIIEENYANIAPVPSNANVNDIDNILNM